MCRSPPGGAEVRRECEMGWRGRQQQPEPERPCGSILNNDFFFPYYKCWERLVMTTFQFLRDQWGSSVKNWFMKGRVQAGYILPMLLRECLGFRFLQGLLFCLFFSSCLCFHMYQLEELSGCLSVIVSVLLLLICCGFRKEINLLC